jgi:hypothetical protein
VTKRAQPDLLAGGNPQIAKGYGDAPVKAYIAAMPGWKRGVGRCLDALIVRTVPGVRKAVKWNSPFYGVEGQGWFLNFHCFTKYIKVAFFRGTSLRPVPPGESKHKAIRTIEVSGPLLEDVVRHLGAGWQRPAERSDPLDIPEHFHFGQWKLFPLLKVFTRFVRKARVTKHSIGGFAIHAAGISGHRLRVLDGAHVRPPS